MSSHSKRRAESEEVAHKKKPRKGEDEFDQDDDGALDIDDVDELDKSNIVSTSRRTRGKRFDNTKAESADLLDDDGTESEGEGQNGKNGALPGHRTRSPERKPTEIIENDEEKEEEEEDYDEEFDEEDDDVGGGDDEDEDE